LLREWSLSNYFFQLGGKKVMKKKVLSILMASTMALGLVACGGGAKQEAPAEPAATEAPAAEEKAEEPAAEEKAEEPAAEETATEDAGAASGDLIKVGIINNDPNESGYRTANDADLKAMFTEANGYDAKFAYSLKNDEQITAAQGFIQDEVDYLLLSAADTAGWDSVLKDAQDAGVKVILFDRTIDADPSLYEASIVSDMAKEGEMAVEWLAGQGLDEYNIIHIQGVMGSAAQQGRSGALSDKVAAESTWNLVTQQTAEWNAEKAQQIVQSVIDAGTPFNVIYAENDDMAKGAVAALDAAGISHGVGKDVIVMGYDCNKWALEELLAQNWNYDGQCNPFQASYIDEIIKTLEGGGTLSEKTIIMDEKGFDAETITQDDVDKYGI
jgi:simple sugar transport system substrate-binding protein